MRKQLVLTIFILVAVLTLTATFARALDYPHTEEMGTVVPINCGDCHYAHGDPPWWDNNQLDPDDTFYNNQCWSCHTGAPNPPLRDTHSSKAVQSETYGEWSIQCWECHDAHNHEQLDTYPADRLYEDTISLTGGIVLNSPVAGQTTIVVDSPSWTDNEFQEDTVNEDFFVVVPNIAEDYYVYKVLDNYFDGGESRNELIIDGLVNTTYAAAGNTFRIYLSKLVRATIATPDMPTCTVNEFNEFVCTNKINMPTRFKDRTGVNSFADGDATYDGVCEVCHTQTSHHRNNDNSPAEADHTHNVQQKCTTCHFHADGFKVDPAQCSTCHGYPPIENVANTVSTGGNTGLVDNPGSTNSATAGAHDRHYNTEGIACSSCHYKSTGSGATHKGSSGDLNVTLGFNLFSGYYQGGDYGGQGSVLYNTTTTSPATNVPSGTAQQCNNIYCHSDVQNGAASGVGLGTYFTPTWENPPALQCGDCHNADGSGTGTYMTSGSHNIHVVTQQFVCNKCHDGFGSGQAKHADNAIDISFDTDNPSGAYSQANGNIPGNGYGVCSSLYCHGDGQPQWGGSNPVVDCTWCHGHDDASASPMELINHPDHVNNASVIGDNFKCGACHNLTVDFNNNLNITGPTNHANGTPTVDFNTQYDPGAVASYSAPTCSSVYCHSTGKDGDFAGTSLPGAYSNNHFTDMTWGDGANLRCNGCHGKTTTATGHPDYTNGGAGTGNANSHDAHVVGKGYNCSICHNDTTDDGETIKSGSLHLDGNKDIAIAAAFDTNGGAVNYSGQTCSATLCHGTGASPQWGGSVGGGCSACHSFPPATGAHATHIQDSAPLTQAYGNTEVVSTGSSYSFGCGNCHPKASDEAALHQNGTVELSLDPADGGTLKSKHDPVENYSQTTGVSVTCSSVYCHSNGYDSGSGYAYQTSPDWFGGSISGICTDCHGNSPNSGTAGSPSHTKHVVGIHYNTIYTGSTGLATEGTGNTNSHGNSTYSTTINCDMCHNNTLQVGLRGYTASRNDSNTTVCNGCHNGEGNQITSGHLDKSNHVSGTVDVALYSTNIKSKAQIRVIDATAPELDNNWNRSVGYKVAGGFDQSVSALNTGSMYDAPNNTCSSIPCHNGNTATWGDASVSCFYCHTEMPETP